MDIVFIEQLSVITTIGVSKPGAVARAANVGVIIERGTNLKGKI